MSGFQQDPGELTPDEMAGRDVDDDGSADVWDGRPTHDELRTRLRQSIRIVKHEQRIAALELQVANLYERLGWRPIE